MFQVENMLKLNAKSQAVQWSEASKRDTKTLMSGLSQTVHNSMGNHLEREVKNMTPHVAKLTAENIQHSLTKEVILSSTLDIFSTKLNRVEFAHLL